VANTGCTGNRHLNCREKIDSPFYSEMYSQLYSRMAKNNDSKNNGSENRFRKRTMAVRIDSGKEQWQ
jgi:hypothetical protein